MALPRTDKKNKQTIWIQDFFKMEVEENSKNTNWRNFLIFLKHICTF